MNTNRALPAAIPGWEDRIAVADPIPPVNVPSEVGPIPRSPLVTRHLLYHCFPARANEGWRHATEQLMRRVDLFNGRRVVAISTWPEAPHLVVPFDDLAPLFESHGFEVLPVPNDLRLREVASFSRLLHAIADRVPLSGTPSSGEAVFYCHSKGNSTTDSRVGAARWRNAMFHHLLDRWPAVSEALQVHSAAGTTKFRWPSERPFRFPSGLTRGSWMFAGTFFWFRCDAVFNRPNWDDVPHDRYGAEGYLAGHVADADAYSLFQPWPPDHFPAGSPYDPQYYGAEFDDPKTARRSS